MSVSNRLFWSCCFSSVSNWASKQSCAVCGSGFPMFQLTCCLKKTLINIKKNPGLKIGAIQLVVTRNRSGSWSCFKPSSCQSRSWIERPPLVHLWWHSGLANRSPLAAKKKWAFSCHASRLPHTKKGCAKEVHSLGPQIRVPLSECRLHWFQELLRWGTGWHLSHITEMQRVHHILLWTRSTLDGGVAIYCPT